ncbi:hypothetical protein, variant [Saprolegnia diclina VS20]|uniref:Uncharacterized protein n=1 Tax=Saprolegnia diclina (strain VS20) TaxID=1156394 RepID=T0QDF7_SAPDV|nr:hypothetical protein SDRG_10770 [Saprolegnia diclina VS20]XP_008615000.1 hypothetical protein, variant [Saprolegnia diclina VS20]EQC31600.1 hypothetical protein SDRG_10770 [Saprolegnia diclina VS20]EQC31601.1 hypothetical protein, variant [Saprolegnia diclina VS20]|eukprot:XP_008614999.1 hypothetical protein SDRG_10770 [Saprolegnia diclina VS20]
MKTVVLASENPAKPLSGKRENHLRALKETLRSRAVRLFDESRERKTSSASSSSSFSLVSSPAGNVALAVKVFSPRAKLRSFDVDDDSDDDQELREPNALVRLRDVHMDPRRLLSGRHGSAIVRAVIRANMIDCLSCKWAPSYFSYVAYGVQRKQLTALEAHSLRWLICQYIIREAKQRSDAQAVLRDQLGRKLTEFRIAVQCVSGLNVVKYGRKGSPHATQLIVENADTIRWTPKLGMQLQNVLHPLTKKKEKSISLSTVIAVQTGFASEVLRKAAAKADKKATPLDPRCCLSLITPTRSLDLVVRNPLECDWLRRSFDLMVAQAYENEKKAAAHVETLIMKKLGSLVVAKYGRKGKPHKTQLSLDKYGEVTWKGKSGGSILLQEVKELRLGHGTPVFLRLAPKSNAKHCVSLVTAARTLDLEMSCESERDYVVLAFRYLLNKMKDRAREAKRMKAERGVRMLQEAYQYHARRMGQLSQAVPQNYDLERYPGASPDTSPMALERYSDPTYDRYPGPLHPTSPVVERVSDRYTGHSGYALERPPQARLPRASNGFPATVSKPVHL